MGKNNRSNAERLEHIKFLMDGNLIQLRKGQETFNDFKWLVEQAESAEKLCTLYNERGGYMTTLSMDKNKLEKEIEYLKETVRIYKVVDEHVREQSKKVKHIFPLENTAGYGQLCDKVVELTEEVIGVALYETKLLHEKLQPEQHSSVGRQFKHIINTLENKTERDI